MADATDLKSVVRKDVGVQVPPRVPPNSPLSNKLRLLAQECQFLQIRALV